VARLAAKAEADEIDVRRADVSGLCVREVERVCVYVCVRACVCMYFIWLPKQRQTRLTCAALMFQVCV